MDTNQINDTVAATTEGGINNHEVALFGDVENTVSQIDIMNEQTDLLNNSGNMYATMLIYLGVIVLIVAALLIFRKFLINRLGNVKNGSYMRILDRLVVAQDKQIALVELKNKILIVGITQQRIETLSEFNRDELEIIEQDDTGVQNSGNSFVRLLGDRLNAADKSNENGRK